jgi:hypothetical protein
MKCTFDVGGFCQGKYEGFGCIKNRCDIYGRRCEFLANTYCQKYKRFFCTGDEDCNTFENYMTVLKGFK